MEIMENKHGTRRCQSKSKSAIFGGIILLFGFLLLLRNTDIISHQTWRIFFSWEMLLIAIGLVNLFDRNRPLGVILIVIGGLFLIPDVFDISFNIHRILWPAVIIIIGLFILFGFSRRRHGFDIISSESNEDMIDEMVVFGGIERNIIAQSFKGGKVLCVFGGSKLNLTQSKLAEGTHILEVVCVFGGTSLTIPPDWNVKIETVQVLGGFDDKRGPVQVDFSKTLIIKGITVFGGGELKLF